MELYNNILCYDKNQECSKITLKGQMREGCERQGHPQLTQAKDNQTTVNVETLT